MSDQTLADAFFNAFDLEYSYRCKIEDAIVKALDLPEQGPWLFGDIKYDSYDYSVELLDAKPGWIPTESQCHALLALGFARFWIVYRDGLERYFRPGDVSGARTRCHLRPHVWTEEIVDGRRNCKLCSDWTDK